MSAQTIQKAIDIVTKAVDEDKKKNYEKALRLYDQAVEYFIHAIQYEAQTEKQKEAIQNKCGQYSDRAENLRRHIESIQAKAKDTNEDNSNSDDCDSADPEHKKLQKKLTDVKAMLTCPLCLGLAFHPTVCLNCASIVSCKRCIERWTKAQMDAGVDVSCPKCRAVWPNDGIKRYIQLKGFDKMLNVFE